MTASMRPALTCHYITKPETVWSSNIYLERPSLHPTRLHQVCNCSPIHTAQAKSFAEIIYKNMSDNKHDVSVAQLL